MQFKELLLHPDILKALETLSFTDPTPIQAESIPLILAGNDIRASAQTGTGKTAAFVLPSLHKLATSPRKKAPRLLILTPTRELATQVADEVKKFSAGLVGLRTVCLFGGVPYPEQNRQLKRPFDILVATPGRLLDQLEQRRVDLSHIETLVLDEADRMLDMGFIDPVLEIASKTPPSRQTLLFSATMKGTVLRLSEKLLSNPKEIFVAPTQRNLEQIQEHFALSEGKQQKTAFVEELLQGREVFQALVFTATKRSADELADHLCSAGWEAASLHGDMRQRHRDRTIRRMRENKVQVLVATDVAARGLDLDTITHVVNFDLPMSPEDYVHRIGRTGRAGRSGSAHSLVSKRDIPLLRQIERFTGKTIPLLAQYKGPAKGPTRAPQRPKRARNARFSRGTYARRSGGS